MLVVSVRVACAVVCRVECVHVEWRGLGLLIEVKGFMNAFLVRLKATTPTELARQIVAGAHGKGGQLVRQWVGGVVVRK